jgi:hypothetical protein
VTQISVIRISFFWSLLHILLSRSFLTRARKRISWVENTNY